MTNINKNDFLHKENNFFQTVTSNSSVIPEQLNQLKIPTLHIIPIWIIYLIIGLGYLRQFPLCRDKKPMLKQIREATAIDW